MTFFGRIGAVVRAVGRAIAHPSWGWSVVTGRSRLNYAATVGDGLGSSIVFACFRALARGFVEAPLQIEKRTEDGWEPIDDHPLVELLARPNPFMGGRLFWSALITSLHGDGNGYAIKRRSGANRLVELWPVPPHLIEPVWRDSDFITAYKYMPGNGIEYFIDPRDVFHVRQDVDPQNIRKGISPLRPLYREIFTDTEAGEFTSQLLANFGVPGVLLTPGKDVRVGPDEAQQIKDSWMQRFGGDRRGEPAVMGAEMDVKVLTFTPQQMNMEMLRRIPEERICAVLGVPPIIAHLGAGLDTATYSNYGQAREAFYENTIIPLQALLADEVRAQLLVDFGPITGLRVAFDQSQIRILQEDENALHERVRANVAAGIWTINEARVATGQEPAPQGDIFLRPVNVLDVGWEERGRLDAPGANPDDPAGSDDTDDQESGSGSDPLAVLIGNRNGTGG